MAGTAGTGPLWPDPLHRPPEDRTGDERGVLVHVREGRENLTILSPFIFFSKAAVFRALRLKNLRSALGRKSSSLFSEPRRSESYCYARMERWLGNILLPVRRLLSCLSCFSWFDARRRTVLD